MLSPLLSHISDLDCFSDTAPTTFFCLMVSFLALKQSLSQVCIEGVFEIIIFYDKE